MALQIEMIHSCYFKMVLWFYYCIHIFKIIYILLNSFTMVGAILIGTCTSAPYRPGHWLLSDVTSEPQTLPLPPLPSPYWTLCGSRHRSVWPLLASLVHFTPILYISPHGQSVEGGGGNYPVCDWGRGPGEDR